MPPPFTNTHKTHTHTRTKHTQTHTNSFLPRYNIHTRMVKHKPKLNLHTWTSTKPQVDEDCTDSVTEGRGFKCQQTAHIYQNHIHSSNRLKHGQVTRNPCDRAHIPRTYSKQTQTSVTNTHYTRTHTHTHTAVTTNTHYTHTSPSKRIHTHLPAHTHTHPNITSSRANRTITPNSHITCIHTHPHTQHLYYMHTHVHTA